MKAVVSTIVALSFLSFLIDLEQLILKNICRSVKFNGIILSLIIIFLIPVMLTSCKEDDYLTEPTAEGLNTHSFKVNGNKWVRFYYYPSTPLNVSGNQMEAFFKSKIQGRGIYRPYGNLLFRIISLKADPNVYEFDNFESVDSTKCFFMFYYYKDDETSSAEALYTNVLSGEFRIKRQDTIMSGTFDAVITNGTDTLTITEGKFDYIINNDN